MAITLCNYNALLLWKINRAQTHHCTNVQKMPARLESSQSLWQTAVFYLERDFWHVIRSIQLGPVSLYLCTALHWAPGSRSRHWWQQHPLGVTDNTQHSDSPVLPVKGIRSQQLQRRVTLWDGENVHHGGPEAAKQANKWNSHILDFAIMGNHLLICKPCLVLWFQFILVDVHHIPSQRTSKGLCKYPHSLCKLNSSGLSWPATPPPLFSQTLRTH